MSTLFLSFQKLSKLILLVFLSVTLPALARADGFKFRIKNTAKTNVAIFYRVNEKGGKFKLKALLKLNPGEEKIKEISVYKGDTVTFYGQDAEDQTSVLVKKEFASLKQNKNNTFYIPIIIPEKESTSFESLDGLSLQLEHNKVLNFMLKMDSSSMSSLAMIENNFQNIYPLGTFLFVDTKTNRLLLPPLEPSFWNNSENYLTIQDSLYTLVNNAHSGTANLQVAYFVAKMFDSLKVSNTAELDFKAKRYRLYFLSSYERIDDLEITGKKFYSFGNEADLSLMTNPALQVFSTNLGVMYTKNKTMSNYYSVQNAVLRTKAYDFTALLFNSFKNNVKNKIIADAYANQHKITAAIVDEYKSLVAYNPDPVRLNLAALDPKDQTPSLVPIETTVSNLSPYSPAAPDTSKLAVAATNNYKIDTYNNKVKFYNSHLKEINTLIKELDQTDNDLTKISQTNTDKSFSSTVSSTGLMNEIEVNSQIVRKE